MAFSKITFNGTTLMDVTQKTVTAGSMLEDITALKNDGTDITGTIESKSSTDLTVSGATVTAPAGYYASNASKSVASGSAKTPATSITANPTISVDSSGLITAAASASKSVTPTVTAGYISSGTAGTVSVSGSNTSQLSTQAAKTVTPTESVQTAVSAGKYTTGAVKVAAIPSDYVGSDIDIRSSTDLTVSGATVTAPAGYYATGASKSVASGSAGTPTASKGTVSNHSVAVTPSVTNTTGYITGGTKTGTAVTVSASELVSGSKSITSNGTDIDVTNYATVDVAVPGIIPVYQEKTNIDPTESSQTITADTGYDALSSVQINAIPSDYVGSGISRRSSSDLTVSGATVTAPAGYYASAASKAVASGSVAVPDTEIPVAMNISLTGATGLVTVVVTGEESVAPTVSAGYVSTGTAGTITVSDSHTMQLQTQAGKTVTPTESVQTAVESGKYTTGAVKVAAIPSTYVGSGIPQNDSTDLTVSGATVSVPSGYYAENASKAVASGSAATPATTITANPTITVNSSTGVVSALVLTTQSVTPTVEEGYVSSGTAGTITVSGGKSAQLSTQEAATITPTESEQTAVAAGKYTLGEVKVGAIASDYVGSGVTRKAAATYNVSTSNRTIAAGTYLTGAQTIRAVKTANIVAENIKDGVTVTVGDSGSAGRIKNITGTFTDASTVTTGQTAAAAGQIVSGYSAWVDGAEVLGEIPSKTSADVEVDDGMVTIPSGYYASQVVITAPIGIEYYYTGSTVPASDLGSDGDLYFKTT